MTIEKKVNFTLRLAPSEIEALEHLAEFERIFAEKPSEFTLRGMAAQFIVQGIEEWKSKRRPQLERKLPKLEEKLERIKKVSELKRAIA